MNSGKKCGKSAKKKSKMVLILFMDLLILGAAAEALLFTYGFLSVVSYRYAGAVYRACGGVGRRFGD